jgi:hypothetical protein
MATSKTYIVTWDELLYNALDVDAQLSAAGLDYLVFDVSTNPEPRPNWVVAEKVRYYGHFYNSLADFVNTDHEIFIFNAGDAICEKQAKAVKRIEHLMEADKDVWLMSPRMEGDYSDGMSTLIKMSKKYYGSVGLSILINGIYVALRRELAVFIYEYYQWLFKNKHMDFYEMTSGHCLDVVYASWVLYNNKKIYRDWDMWMKTIPGTSYDTTRTFKECTHIKSMFKKYVGLLGYNEDTIQRIYDAISEKETEFRSVEYPVVKAYPNLIHERELDY